MRFVRTALLCSLLWSPAVLCAFSANAQGQDTSGAKVASKARAKPREGTPRAKRNRAKRARQAKHAARKRRRPRVSPAYRAMVRRWHTRAPKSQIRAWRAKEPPPLVLRRIHKPMYVELLPEPDGTFSTIECQRAEEALASKNEGATHEVHPRLLELVYRAVLKFRAPYVHVVSGYREARASSRHAQGRAMDIVLPGVGNGRLARFFREQGFVGVGIYPRSGFVHIDVRSSSYYWRDASLPGATQNPRPILAKDRARNDARARKRGEIAVPDLTDEDTPEVLPDPDPTLVTIDPIIVNPPKP